VQQRQLPNGRHLVLLLLLLLLLQFDVEEFCYAPSTVLTILFSSLHAIPICFVVVCFFFSLLFYSSSLLLFWLSFAMSAVFSFLQSHSKVPVLFLRTWTPTRVKVGRLS
jgi:hypothetical protein